MSQYDNIFDHFDPFENSLQQPFLEFAAEPLSNQLPNFECFYQSDQEQPKVLDKDELQIQPLSEATSKQFQNIHINEFDSQLSLEDHIQLLQKNFCLRTAALSDIQSYLRQNFQSFPENLTSQAYQRAIKAVIKRKLILKRQKAKARTLPYLSNELQMDKDYIAGQEPLNSRKKCQKKGSKKVPEGVPVTEDKRKRNRMSAQSSRDRRKTYLVDLERKNQILKEEFDQVQMQNEKLKRQLQLFQKASNAKQSQSEAGPKQGKRSEGQSKFMKLLVFLGILFMISVMKDFFGGSTTKSFFQQKSSYGEFQKIELQDRHRLNPMDLEQENQKWGELDKSQFVKETSQLLSKQLSQYTISSGMGLSIIGESHQKPRRTKIGREESSMMSEEEFKSSYFISSIGGSGALPMESSQAFTYLMGRLPSPNEFIRLPRTIIEKINEARLLVI